MSSDDLAIMRDRLHLEFHFAGSRMLRGCWLPRGSRLAAPSFDHKHNQLLAENLLMITLVIRLNNIGSVIMTSPKCHYDTIDKVSTE